MKNKEKQSLHDFLLATILSGLLFFVTHEPNLLLFNVSLTDDPMLFCYIFPLFQCVTRKAEFLILNTTRYGDHFRALDQSVIALVIKTDTVSLKK